MRAKSNLRLLVLALAAVATLAHVGPAFGADSLFICQSGVPFVYPSGGANIPWNPDLGGLGPLTNAQAVQAVQDAFDRWENVSASSATFVNAGFLPVDITVANYGPIFSGAGGPNGFSEIVFDEDGSIFVDLGLGGTGVLGFAGPDFGDPVTCELIEGSAFLNGPAFTDPIVAEDIMVHEFGHFINLGHVELNGQIPAHGEGGDDTGPTPDNATFGPLGPIGGTEVIETMYPFYFGSAAGTRTPHADDVASIGTLYPGAGFPASRGRITGAIFASNGTTRLSGVNVIARNLANPFVDAVSTFSGAYTDSTDPNDPNVGIFQLDNLTPGATYALFVDQVTALAGRFSNPIIALPGPEEFWNAGESNNITSPDPPLVFTGITVAAGSTNSASIIFNSPAPGDPLPVGDDGFVQLALPFAFDLCGATYNSLFVNANGSVTFGAGSTDFTESAAEMLAGPPRIAGVWDDLNPAAGGVVTFAESANTFSVIWDDVPEWLDTGTVNFAITLRRNSNNVDVDYGDLTPIDGLAGVSCGGMWTSGSEPQVDLSSFSDRINLTQTAAAYEVFGGANPLDLANSSVLYSGSKQFKDKFEDNDTPADAASVALPFNTDGKKSYTDIFPVGDDIDWFSFSTAAGDIVVAEVVAGTLDSLIALFDSTGALVAIDDDGGAGLLSRIAVPVGGGTHFLAVTTFPDFGLTGNGNSGGRYVLDLQASDELPLALGDDTSAEVALPFSFPFQGSNWSSVWVNSNGNLTFGSGDSDFSESVSELLSDQPRIAPLWDDLSPNNAGTVSVSFGASSVTVSYVGVPEFTTTGSNTFSVTLHSDGTVDVDYGAVSALDGITGVTQGGGAANPGETNLSAGGPFSAVGTTFEQFTGAGDPFDLAGASLTFDP